MATKTIVLGYDDSPQANRALDRAESLPARILVMSVAPLMSFAGRGIGPYDPADPPSAIGPSRTTPRRGSASTGSTPTRSQGSATG